MKFVQNFNRTTLAVTQNKFVFCNLQNFHLLENVFLFFFTLFIIYNLNDTFVIYQNCSTFQTKQVGNTHRGLVFSNLKIFMF